MAFRIFLHSSLIYIILFDFGSFASDNINTINKCQTAKSFRKQVNAEPLHGMCLRDIVLQLSDTFGTIINEELGSKSFQKLLYQQEFTNISNNLEKELNILVNKLNRKLKLHIDLIQQCDSIIQPILLKRQIDQSQSLKMDFAENKVMDFCTPIISGLAAHLRNEEWKNLHVLPVNQPATLCGTPSLAHNIGPLLLSQCPIKNIILLIEQSTFMSEGDFTLAQITAKTIIDMLSEMDMVMVVGLNSYGSMNCKNGLLKATDLNKYQLARYIDNMNRLDTNQSLNIDLVSHTQNLEGEVVIIHLTNTLKRLEQMQNNIDKISSKNLSAYLRTILILSDQESHRKLKESMKNGNIITLPTQNILGYEIAELFAGLKCMHQNKKDYYLSDPYFDPYSKTMITSMGQITNTALLSLDIKLQDFVDDITYFNAGPNTYAVIFDTKEVVWMHKNFPRMENVVEQPLKVYLSNIENIDNETIATMINKTQGSLNVTTQSQVKQYRWKHLTYKDLIICLVTVINNKSNEQLSVMKTFTPPKNIMHHRLDLILQVNIDNNLLCTHQNKIMTLATGVVYLSPWCFQSPMEQLKLLETGSAVTVQSYMAYIKNGLLSNPGLQQSVRPDVAMLAQTLDHFKKQHLDSPLNKFIIRRYVVAKVSGVLEIYPGMVLDSGLDPKRRTWYSTTLEHADKIVFTPPYLDAGGSGYVVTISHTVRRRGFTSENQDSVIAIMAMDISIGYISRLLSETYPFCNDSTVKCFLMDDKGYLVSHPSLLEASGKIELQHLTNKELLVANDILNHEYFVKKKLCASHLDGTVQRYYQFNTSLEDVLTNIVHGEHCIKYQVAAIPNTNIFLGVVNVTCNLLRAFCPCSTTDRSCLNCRRMEQTECECPCECPLYSATCSQNLVNNLEPCPAPLEQGAIMQTSWIPPTNLNACPMLKCKEYQTEKDCLGIVGCQWCSLDGDGETPLPTPYCSEMSTCFRGVFGSPIPYSDGSYNSQSTDELLVRSVGPVAGGILAFVLILGITLFCYRLRSVNSGLEHQCLHLHTAPDTLRMTHLEGDADPMDFDQTKNNLHSLIRDSVATVSPYRVSTNYRRPPGGDSDHGYSTMTPHDDSEQQTFVEPLLIVGDSVESDMARQSICLPSPTTHLGSPHHVLAPVTVHHNMETNFC